MVVTSQNVRNCAMLFKVWKDRWVLTSYRDTLCCSLFCSSVQVLRCVRGYSANVAGLCGNISWFFKISNELDVTTGRENVISYILRLTYANLHFPLKLLMWRRPGPTVFFKRRTRNQRKSKYNAVFSTPSFITISSGIVSVVIVFRYCMVQFFFKSTKLRRRAFKLWSCFLLHL